MDFEDVPGIDVASVEKANSKLGSSSSSSKKARTDATVTSASFSLFFFRGHD